MQILFVIWLTICTLIAFSLYVIVQDWQLRMDWHKFTRGQWVVLYVMRLFAVLALFSWLAVLFR